MKQYLVVMVLALIFMSGLMPSCKKSNSTLPAKGPSAVSAVSQYLPDWDGLRLQDPQNAVTTEDETMYCYGGTSSTVLHFRYKKVAYECALHSETPEQLSSGTAKSGWEYQATVRQASLELPAVLGRYNLSGEEYYELRFTNGGGGVFKSSRYIKKF